MRFSILLLLGTAMLAVTVISGCGQQGPLYLPEDVAPVPPTSAPVEPQP